MTAPSSLDPTLPLTKRGTAYRAALVGFLGSLIVVAGRLAWFAASKDQEYLPWALRVRAILGENAAGPLTVLGSCMLLLAWQLLRIDLANPRLRLLAVFACWVLPLLPMAGIMSSDPRYYADIGWMIAHGHNPYHTGLGTTGSPFPVGPTWHGTFAVYPALGLRLFGWLVGATGADWYWSVVAMRILALAGVGLLALSLRSIAPRIGVDHRFALWLGVFNPVTMLHGVGGSHIDMLMTGLVAAALSLTLRTNSPVLGALVVGLAAAVKQPALLAAVPVALLTDRPHPSWLRTIVRASAAIAVALAALVAVSWASGLGMGWIDAAHTTYSIHTVGVGYLLGEVVRMVTMAFGANAGVDVDLANTLVGGLGLVLIVVQFFRYRQRPWQFLAAATLTWAVTNGAFREWYLIFWLAFLPLADLGSWMRRAASVLVPFAMAYSAFKSYLDWQIMPSTYLSAAIAIAANAGGWLVAGEDGPSPPDAEPNPAPEPDGDQYEVPPDTEQSEKEVGFSEAHLPLESS